MATHLLAPCPLNHPQNFLGTPGEPLSFLQGSVVLCCAVYKYSREWRLCTRDASLYLNTLDSWLLQQPPLKGVRGTGWRGPGTEALCLRLRGGKADAASKGNERTDKNEWGIERVVTLRESLCKNKLADLRGSSESRKKTNLKQGRYKVYYMYGWLSHSPVSLLMYSISKNTCVRACWRAWVHTRIYYYVYVC